MKQTIIKIALLTFVFTNACAHPHTFIEVKPTMEIKENKIDKFHIKWILDEMTSMMMIMELDSNANGKFEKDENNFIYENYFQSLKDYNFYMELISNNKKLPIKPKNFKASIKNDRLIYTFDIEQKIDTKTLEIAFFDTELFVGMMLEKDYITLKGLKKEDINQFKQKVFGVN